jgi:hypothetical protein
MMPELEAALADHHALLISEGLAVEVPPPKAPDYLVPKKATGAGQTMMGSGALLDTTRDIGELGLEDSATERLSRRSSQRSSAAANQRRTPALRRRNGPSIQLFDWESAYIDELARWGGILSTASPSDLLACMACAAAAALCVIAVSYACLFVVGVV